MLNPQLIAGRSLDAKLTDRGWDEAFSKGEELARRGVLPDYVVSSPAVRCIQTGRQILASMGLQLTISTVDDLVEMDQGASVGRDRTEVYNEVVHKQIVALGKDFALPGGESMNQVGKRGLDWLRSQETLTSIKKNLSIFAIAHGGLITHTVGAIEKWDHAQSYAMLRSMPPLGETLIVFDSIGWHVETFAAPLQAH